jgi:hypothetical protein
MPRKYTKKKGRKKIKRGGTLTKKLSDGENIMNNEIIILKNRLDELEMKLEICCSDMVQGANTIQRVYRGHQGRNTFKQTRRTMKPNVTDALLDLPQDVGDLITSQVTKYKKGMTYDEFVQYIKSKDLYGCFNIIREHVLTNTIGRFRNYLGEDGKFDLDYTETSSKKTSNCVDKFSRKGPYKHTRRGAKKITEPERTWGEIDDILFNWYTDLDLFMHIDDLDEFLKLKYLKKDETLEDFKHLPVFSAEEATRLSKEYHKNLPEYREENLREAYQYYIEQWNKLYL